MPLKRRFFRMVRTLKRILKQRREHKIQMGGLKCSKFIRNSKKQKNQEPGPHIRDGIIFLKQSPTRYPNITEYNKGSNQFERRKVFVKTTTNQPETLNIVLYCIFFIQYTVDKPQQQPNIANTANIAKFSYMNNLSCPNCSQFSCNNLTSRNHNSFWKLRLRLVLTSTEQQRDSALMFVPCRTR